MAVTRMPATVLAGFPGASTAGLPKRGLALPRPGWSLRELGLALALGLGLAGGAAAHPHVFIDGGVDFRFDAEGRLVELRVTWIYDPLSSLFMLEDLGIDPAAATLAPEEAAALAAWQTEWIAGYEGDGYLWHDGRRIGLSGPAAPEAALEGGQAVIRFLRRLETPIRPSEDTRVEVYDPTYYTAYRVTEEPALEGSAAGCRARVENFEPTASLSGLMQDLMAIPADGEPQDGDVGALFAEKVHLSCG